VNIPARWFVEPITIETYQGQGAYGDSYAEAITVLGHVSGGRRVQGSNAQELVSERRVMLPNPTRLADGSGTVDPVAVLQPESRVTASFVTAVIGQVEPHVQPGTGAVVYVSGTLV
jgi:hypothetical protein